MAEKKNFGSPATPWKKGDRFSASHLNEVVAVANRFAGFSGGEDIDVGGDPKSTNVSKVNKHRQTQMAVMQIVGMGPGGQPDFTNGLYWGKRQQVDPSIAPWVSLKFIDNSPGYATNGTDFADIYPDAVENLPERGMGTHSLGTNGLTYVLALGQTDDGGMVRWTCDRPTGPFVAPVTQTGGGAGDQVTTCTFTYDVMQGTNTLATGVSVDGGRPVMATYMAGTIGLAYYKSTGGIGLYSVTNEKIDQSNCGS